MKRLQCEVCQSTKIIKANGVFTCQECGCSYSLDEVKSLMVEVADDGSNASVVASTVTGSAQNDRTSEDIVKKNLLAARNALRILDTEGMVRYYRTVELEDPGNFEASFFCAYAKAKESMTKDEVYEREAIFKVLINCVKTLPQRMSDGIPEIELLQLINTSIISLCSSEFVYTRTSNAYVVETNVPRSTAIFLELISIWLEVLKFFYLRMKISQLRDMIEESAKVGENLHANMFPFQMQQPIDKVRNAYIPIFQKFQQFSFQESMKQKIEQNGSPLLFSDYCHLTFGSFLGKPLKWQVISTEGDVLLLLCDYCVARGAYDYSYSSSTPFSKTSIGIYLNEYFKNKAFNSEEQKYLVQEVPITIPTVAQVSSTVKKVALLLENERACWWWANTPSTSLFKVAMSAFSPSGELSTKYAPDDNRMGYRPLILVRKSLQ